MDKLKKMKLLLLLPIVGDIVIMFYLNIKSRKIPYIKYMHWFFVGLSMWLMFMLGSLLIATFLLVVINKFVDINDFIYTPGGIIFALIIGGYFENIPCLIYVNYILKKSKDDSVITSDNNSGKDDM